MCKHPSHLGMQLKHLVYKICVHLHKFIVLSIVVALAVSLLCQKAKIVMGARKSYIGAWRKKRRQSINAATMPWSLHRERWVQERAAASSKANKRVVVLRNNHILVFFVVRKHAHILNAWLTVPKAHATLLTVIHMCWFKGHGDAHEAHTVNT